jgi:hypothetical protein
MRICVIILCLVLPAAVSAFPFMLGIRASTPQILSVSLTVRPTSLWFVQLEPGVGGGKVALGVGGSWDYKFGLGLKSSLLYTWGKPIGDVETGQTYAGGEGVIMISGINLTFGLYGHVAGDDPEKDMLVSAGAGFGF